MDDVLLDAIPDMGTGESELKAACAEPHINVCLQKWVLSDERQQVYDAAVRKLADFTAAYASENADCYIDLLEFAPLDHDMEMAQQFYDLLPEELHAKCRKICLANFYAGDAVKLIKTARLNIGTRFHMALYSLSANPAVPAVSISLDDYYAIKLRAIHSMFGSSNVWDIADLPRLQPADILNFSGKPIKDSKVDLRTLKAEKLRKYESDSLNSRIDWLIGDVEKRDADANGRIDRMAEKAALPEDDITLLKQGLDDIRNSKSYKLGRALTWLPRKLLEKIKREGKTKE